MNFALLVGWLAQVVAVAMLFARVRRAWVQHLGAIFILLAVTYHGLGELLFRLLPDRNTYRLNVTEAGQDSFFVAISMAILLLTIAYVGTLSRPSTIYPLDVEELRHYFDWRVMLVLTAPLLLWTFSGAGKLAQFDMNDPSRQTASSGLTGQFLMIALTMTSVAIVLRFGPRLLVPMMFIEAAILASIGQRTGVVVGLLLLLYAAARIGVRPSRRLLVGLAVFGLFVMLVITSARATTGREPFAGGVGAGARLDSLTAGVTHIGSKGTRDLLLFDAGYRLDGNAFPSLELERIGQGATGLGVAPILNNTRLAVPSALDSGKLGLPLEVRSEKYFAQVRLGLPLRDSLYTQLGGTVGYFGWPGLLVIAALMGVLFGRLDTALLAGATPKRLLIGVGALNAITYYSASLDHWFITARGVLLLLFGIWALQTIRRSASHRIAPGPRRSSAG